MYLNSAIKAATVPLKYIHILVIRIIRINVCSQLQLIVATELEFEVLTKTSFFLA